MRAVLVPTLFFVSCYHFSFFCLFFLITRVCHHVSSTCGARIDPPSDFFSRHGDLYQVVNRPKMVNKTSSVQILLLDGRLLIDYTCVVLGTTL